MLDTLIASVDRSFKNAFEFRHVSWWNEDVFKRFKKQKIIFCGVSFPKLPDEIAVTARDIYYRFSWYTRFI